MGYASLTHGYNLAVARLASCTDAPRYRYYDIHAAENVRIGREPGGECRRDLARGKRSATPGYQRTQENASVQDANYLCLQNLHNVISQKAPKVLDHA